MAEVAPGSRGLALLVPGKPKPDRFTNPELLDPSHPDWFSYVRRRFELAGYLAYCLRWRDPPSPQLCEVMDELDRYKPELNNGVPVTVIAYSLGSAAVVHYLHQHPGASITRLVHVAPWHDPKNKYGFKLPGVRKLSDLRHQVEKVETHYDPDDSEQVQMAVRQLPLIFPGSQQSKHPGRRHFQWGDSMESGDDFPELKP